MITRRRSNGGADPKCTLPAEVKPGYHFIDEVSRPTTIEKVDLESIGTHGRCHGVHGYGLTQVNYFTTAIFAGLQIKSDVTVEHTRLVDEGPTFAKLLGLHYPTSTAGQVIDAIFED